MNDKCFKVSIFLTLNLQPWPLATLREQPSTLAFGHATRTTFNLQPWPLATLREQPSNLQPSTFNQQTFNQQTFNLQLSKGNHTPNRLTLMHQIEGIINFF
ncbi:MAG: hypothetical protein F6K26_06685 [Moorea sp. SIO2I5]|nr:hypothetical protein [Moorena sp. SIO2I5]